MKQNILIFLSLLFSIELMASQYIVGIEKEGYIKLINFENKDVKTIYSWKESTIDKWNQPKLHMAAMAEGIITVIIYQTYQKGLRFNRDISLITELGYDENNQKLIYCRQYLYDRNEEIKIDTKISGTFYSPVLTSINNKDFLNIYYYNKSELTNGFYFFEFSGLCMVPESELDSFYKRYNYMQYQNLLIEPTYKAPSKLAYWGVETYNIKQDKSFILVDFLLQERIFYFSKRKPISYIYEIDLATKAQKVLLTNGIRPSYSSDGKNVLYEKVYYSWGFFRLKTKGYFIWNRQTEDEMYLGKFTDAMFVKDFN